MSFIALRVQLVAIFMDVNVPIAIIVIFDAMLQIVNKQNDKLSIGLLAMQLLYWMVAFMFFCFFYGQEHLSVMYSLFFVFCYFAVAFFSVAFFNRFLVNRYLFGRQYLRFAFFSLYTFIALFWIESLLTLFLYGLYWRLTADNILHEIFTMRYQTGGVNMVVFGGITVNFVKQVFLLYRQRDQDEKLRIVKDLKFKDIELSLLKSQLNPHFLFNSLNCIYGLSLEKSDDAPNVILKLSQILDYALYQSNKATVSLRDELAQIENYSIIQKARFGDMLNVNIITSIEGDKQIEPLLLLPLVENAFKHGGPSDDGIMHVDIFLKAKDRITFSIENSVGQKHRALTDNGGIGLINLKRRLELLYPMKHALSINQSTSRFILELELLQ
jgi:two-component system, LytTR family, sensor kinase